MADRLIETVNEVLGELESKGMHLTQNGFNDPKGVYNRSVFLTSEALQNVLAATDEIPHLPQRQRKGWVQDPCSYAIKHSLERYRGRCGANRHYISNGELILATLILGYSIKGYKDSPNVIYKTKFLD
mgnify:FL=1